MLHSSGTVSESQNCKITVFKNKNGSWWYNKYFNACSVIPGFSGALFLSLQVAARSPRLLVYNHNVGVCDI